jgi:hypothetical protein
MQNIQPGKVYIHYKEGSRYTVLFLVKESTNARSGGDGVVYVSLTTGSIRHRDLSEFVEDVKWPDGVIRARFIPEEPE